MEFVYSNDDFKGNGYIFKVFVEFIWYDMFCSENFVEKFWFVLDLKSVYSN